MVRSPKPKKSRIEMRACVLILVMAMVCLAPTHAQEAGGTIVGAVTDPSGAAIANATVTVRNVATGVERVVPTNTDGLYVVPNLVPGSYQIKADATGFASTVMNDIVLTVGERREINISLKVGQASDKVTVEGSEIPDIQLASSSVGNVVDSHTVVELPLNGRDWTSLTLLEPGVAQVRTQKALGIGNDRANRGQGVDVTIGGNRPQGNNYRLDGVSINDQTSGAPGSIQGSVLGVDAVQEFSVVTSNAPADYGKTSGGVINAVSRSGTNSLHGTAYEFLRNDKLDARNFFARATKPPLRRNQFGGSAGGPIIKDHTFFFADYEGVRQVIGNPSGNVIVPSQSTAQINFVTANHPEILPYLTLYPKPNSGALSGIEPNTTGTFTFVSKTVTNENFFTSRIDHNISASDKLFGTYVFDKGNNANPDALDLNNIGTISRRHTVAIEESHVFSPTLLNSARFGFNRTVSLAPTTLGSINSAAANTSLGFIPGRAVGLINVSGIANFTGGPHGVGEFDFHYNSFQAYEDLYWTRSKHSLKFGFYAERIQSNQLGGANPSGQFIFGSLSDFLNNNAALSFNGPLASGITPRDLRQTIYSGYVQDDYKLRPNLTVNLGLRYEMSTVPTETANRLSTLVNLRTDTAPKLGSPYFSNSTLRNFAPRVGFAWDPFGTGKTSVRGAFGMYDVLPLPYEFELLSLFSTPFFEAATIRPPLLAAGDFPTNAWVKANDFVATNPSPNKVLRNGYLDPNPHRSYVMQWTLNVQRELFRDFTVTAGYVGSHGVHQPFHADDVNDFLPISTPAGLLWPNANNAAQQVATNPNVGQISSLMWATSSVYHGLTLSAIRRLSHGFQIQGSYTYSRSIDDSSSGIAGDTFGNSVSSLFWFNPRLRRGLSDFNVSQLAVINAIWMVPSPQSWSTVPKWVASGWQLGGIYTVGSGLPFTPTIGGDPLGVKSPAGENFDFPNRVAGCNPVNGNFKSGPLGPGLSPVGPHYLNTNCFALPTAPGLAAGMCTAFAAAPSTCANLLGNSGRNTVIGPGLQNLDFSLFKNNPIHRISETFNVQFRWEIFNIANHANFNPPLPGNRQIFLSTGAPNPSAGLLNATSTPSRQMQFAMKFIW